MRNTKAAATSPEVASRKLRIIAMPANLRQEIDFVDFRNDRILVRIKSRVIVAGRSFLPSSAPMASRRNFIAVQSESITGKIPLTGRPPLFGLGALFNQTGMTISDQVP